MAAKRETDAASLRLPGRTTGPVVAITRRLLGALAILLAVVAVVLPDRDGYRDVTADRVGVLDGPYGRWSSTRSAERRASSPSRWPP